MLSGFLRKSKILIVFLCLVIAVLGIVFWLDTKAFFNGGQSFFDMAERRLHHMFGTKLLGTPDLNRLDERLKAKGVELGSPIFMRIFKKESELEIWMKKDDQYVLFETYPICRWSGVIGPKLRQGDRQAPEGFYTVGKTQLNPNSRWYRSFNLGYPNLLDRAYKRTGDALMVHGGCSSIGCFAMTNPVMTEIWLIVNKSLDEGQKRFHVHSYPFRMTELNMTIHRNHQWYDFWQDLKIGYDMFEQTKKPPLVRVCDKRYRIEENHGNGVGDEAIIAACPTVSINTVSMNLAPVME